jgi:hypothetical protein
MTTDRTHTMAPTQRDIVRATPGVDWLSVRPAPTARSAGEIELAKAAVDGLAVTDDPRLVALAGGAQLAIKWTDIGGRAPASGRDVGAPCVREIAQEIYRAGRAAAGQPCALIGRMDDRDRILGRGVQEWLAWAYVQGYPTPLWLVSGMPASEIHAFVLGRVGLGPGGLDGPASAEPFGYDVDDRIDAIRID